jgi:predicted RNA-binding protein YlxR (DUF448 family)/ribosomal protein L7Ae-like RNA K-turn-binding protein
MCIACREMKAKRELIRVVRTPDGAVVTDATGKLAGRGAYVCNDPACVALAKKQRRFERSFEAADCEAVYLVLAETAQAAADARAQAANGGGDSGQGDNGKSDSRADREQSGGGRGGEPKSAPERERKAYGLLGLAAKKGSVISGGDACERALRGGSDGFLIVAEDASDNTKERFSRIVYGKGVERRIFGTCSELGKHTGKDERSVLIVTDQGIARGLALLMDGVAGENGGGKFGKNQSL